MAATGTPTPNLGLRIPLGTDPASVDDINYNSNALDTVIGDIGETSVAGQLSATNNRISAVQDGLAIVCNGNTHAAIEAGQFAYVKNHGTLAEGLYRNNTGSTIAANATLSSSNLTADTSGGLNTVYDALNSKITNLFTKVSESNNVDAVADTFVYGGISITIPANSYYSLQANAGYNNSPPRGALLSTSSASHSPYETWAKSADDSCACTICGYTQFQLTLYAWGKWSGSTRNGIVVTGWYRTL